ncbi:MAG: hypothetical protein RSD06_04840 [Bacilli bacterium]
MIKNIIKLTNVDEYNKHHNEKYLNKKGVLIIETDDNVRHILDLESMTDLTDCDYIDIQIKNGKTKTEYLFKNIIYDIERLERLSNGK